MVPGASGAMLIFQLPRFSSANIGDFESNISLYVNHRQVVPQGLWDLHVLKLNGKHVCSVRKFA